MFEYAKRLSEVDVIINLLPKEDYEKIPKDLIQMIRDNKDDEYLWEYDERKKLHEQGLNRNTIAILSYINMNYLLNEEQKRVLEEIHKNNERKATKARNKNQNSIFNNEIVKTSASNYEVETTSYNSNALAVESVKINFLKRCMNKLKNIFKMN